MAIKALVLDLDGTLYGKSGEDKVNLACARRTREYLKKKGILSGMQKRDIKKIDKNILHGSVIYAARNVGTKYGINLKDLEAYAYDIYPKDVGIKRDGEMIRLLTVLSRRYELAILSNGYDAWVKRVLRVLGISHLIRKGMIVSTLHLKRYLKPDPESFRILLNRTGFKKSEVLLLDRPASGTYGGRGGWA